MIQHVTRQVRPEALEPCTRFYALLGFVPVSAPEGVAGRAVWLQLGPTQLHLLLDPYEATLQRLRDAGHTVEPRRQHWGAARSYVHDPSGQLVELMAAPPPGNV